MGCFDNGRKWLKLAKVGRKKEREICPHWPIPAIFCHYQNSPRQVSHLTSTNNNTAQASVLRGVEASPVSNVSRRFGTTFCALARTTKNCRFRTSHIQAVLRTCVMFKKSRVDESGYKPASRWDLIGLVVILAGKIVSRLLYTLFELYT